MQGEIHEARESEVRYIAARLREDDKRELEALGEPDPYAAVMMSYHASDVCMVGTLDNIPCIVFGAEGSVFAGELDFPASVWALGTDRCFGSPKNMVRFGRKFVREAAERYGYIENWCDARYTKALNWLRRLGFTVEKPQPFGVKNMPFCKLWMRAEKEAR